MQLRQEQVVFAATVALVGFGVLRWKPADEDTSRRSRSRGGGAVGGIEAERYPAPPALPTAPESTPLERALLSAPRDTRPLEPLAFEAPEMPAQTVLLAPPPSAPEAALWATWLQRPGAGIEAPGLFDAVACAGGEAEGGATDDASAFRGAESWNDLDPAERMEASSAFRTIYDWMRVDETETLFGRITSPDRYGLARPERAEDPIAFVAVDPFSGAERYPGQPPIEYARERVLEWGLADTLPNRLEQRYAALPQMPTPGTYPEFLQLGQDALDARLEVPRGLELARDLMARAREFDPTDPTPAILLADAQRAAFEIEPAFDAYLAAAENFPSRPEPWIGRATLEGELLLHGAAERSFERATQLDPGGWQAAAAFGRYRLGRGQWGPALEQLEVAENNLPGDAASKDARVAVRLDLARAQLGVGRVREAHATFSQALAADALNQAAMAGRVACALCNPELDFAPAGEALEDPQAFGALEPELLVALALAEVDRGSPERAKQLLERSLELLPLHPEQALRGLSFLADRAGEPELALNYVERALEAAPTDIWALYQRGRLLREGSNLDAAAASLRAALERESEFEDALMELGLVELERGRSQNATRLFERAFELSQRRTENDSELSARADAPALLGTAELREESFLGATEAFETALRLDPERLDALAGLAWCRYRLGDREEATIQLRALDDTLRNEPADHPYRVWALAQIERLDEHASKDIWADAFEYQTIGNAWERAEAAGPQVRLENGVARIDGTFGKTGETRFTRSYAGEEFIAVEAHVRVGAGATSRAGLFVGRERRSAGGDKQQGYAGVARSRDGAAQVRVFGGGDDPGWIDLDAGAFPFPADKWVRIRIELRGSGSKAAVDIYMDGVPVVQGAQASGLARGNNALDVGAFVEGDNGRIADLWLDDVEVTRRRPR